MAITSIDIDQANLKQAKELAGTTSNRETVDLALRTLIAVRRQPSAVECIISRRFEPGQINAPTITQPRAAGSTRPTPGPRSRPNGRIDTRDGRRGMLTKDQRRELALNTMASWALDGMEPDREMAEDIEAYIKGDVTIEELIEKAKLMSMPEAAEYRAAKLVDDGERVSLGELLSERDEGFSVHYVTDKLGLGGHGTRP